MLSVTVAVVASVAVPGTILPVPSKDVPPIVRAVANAVAVVASVAVPGTILPVPSKDVPPIVLAVASAVDVAASVAFPAVKFAAVPVRLVATPDAGVPKAGVTRVGEVAKTAAPVPVSSDSTPANCAEVVAANCDKGLAVRPAPVVANV